MTTRSLPRFRIAACGFLLPAWWCDVPASLAAGTWWPEAVERAGSWQLPADDLPLLILVLLYAAIGGYHLQLFRHDPRFREYLWFGATAIVIAVHTLLFTRWASMIAGGHPLLRRLDLATGAVAVTAAIQFLWPFLGHAVGGWLRAYQRSLVVLAGLALVWPAPWATPLWQSVGKLWGLPFLPVAALLVTRELRRGNAAAKTIALGSVAVAGVGLADLILQLYGKVHVLPLPAYAFAPFAVSMAFSLANRFSRVHADLDVLRLQLEGMVEDRAAELSAANQRLRSEMAERELAQEAMRMLERAVEQSIDGILVADLEETILFANQAWAGLHGREIFEIHGRRLDLFHPGEIMDQVRLALERVRQEGSWAGEIEHQRKDGSTFPAWSSITLLRDPAGQPVGFVTATRDVSERRRAAEQRLLIESRLQQAEKLRSLAELAAGIAHDYNNLLTGVLGNSSLALGELPAASPVADKLEQIGNAAERAAELTAQLLAYAGAEEPALLLPGAGGEPEATERDDGALPGPARGRGTVLVVDDEYIMREVSRSILEQSGFEVLATGEGLEALELYRRHMASIRLVLVDRTMPTMPGEEVLERILALNPDARILLMSGYRSDSTVRELTDKHLAEFLQKPFRPQELMEKVRSMIG